jgi:hypothetical protein
METTSMNTMKTYVIVGLCGLVAGLILSERWRTTGLRVPAAEPETEGEAEPGAVTTARKASAEQPTVSTIVAGAKADAERARQLLVRMTPWGER